jgi:hypothetical protein
MPRAIGAIDSGSVHCEASSMMQQRNGLLLLLNNNDKN